MFALKNYWFKLDDENGCWLKPLSPRALKYARNEQHEVDQVCSIVRFSVVDDDGEYVFDTIDDVLDGFPMQYAIKVVEEVATKVTKGVDIGDPLQDLSI